MVVYYFTRTNESEQLAQQLAKKHNTQAHKLSDGKDWSGKLNFIKAAGAAKKKETPKVTYPQVEDNQEIVLVFPMWAGTFPPAVRSFLTEQSGKKITAIVLSGSPKAKLSEEEQKMFFKVWSVGGKNKTLPKEFL